MESKIVKKYGILEVLKEGNKYYLSLPGKELREIPSAREIDILEQFETISTTTMGDFIVEVAKLDGENYVIVKKDDFLSPRGYDLKEVHPGSKKVVTFRRKFFSSINLPMGGYTIRKGKMCKV